MAGTPRPLPIELWERIIDMTKEDFYKDLVPVFSKNATNATRRKVRQQAAAVRRTLSACALVCRSWLPRCRYNLVEALSLHSAEQVTYFAKLLSQSPLLLPRIWVLVIDGQHGMDQSWISMIPDHLPLAQMRLYTLVLRGVDLTQVHPRVYHTLSLYRTLSTVCLEGVRYSRFSHLARFASLVPMKNFNIEKCTLVPRGGGGGRESSSDKLVEAGRFDFHGQQLQEFWMALSWEELLKMSCGWRIYAPLVSLISLNVVEESYAYPEGGEKAWEGIWSNIALLFSQLCAARDRSSFIEVRVKSLKRMQVWMRQGKRRKSLILHVAELALTHLRSR